MKKIDVKRFVLLGLLLSVSAICVYAQGKPLIHKVEIPFDFSIGDKTLPAGAYSVTRVNQEKIMLRLRRDDGRETINIITSTVQTNEAPKTGKLVFRRYGKTYFLFQIWESDEVQGHQLQRSRAERSFERDLTKIGEEPSTVDLAVVTP